MSYLCVFKWSPLGVKNLLKPRPDWSPLGVTKSSSQAQMVSFRVSKNFWSPHPPLSYKMNFPLNIILRKGYYLFYKRKKMFI